MPEYHIYLGADHRGFEKKEALFPILSDCHENVVVEDLGAESYVEDDDFNGPALAVAQAVANNDFAFGVLLCGSAHGVCMQANRVRGARAIYAKSEESVRKGRTEDHANILCLPAEELDVDEMERLIKAFCHAQPSNEERYLRRIRRLDEGMQGKGDDAQVGFKLKMASDGHSEDDDEEE